VLRWSFRLCWQQFETTAHRKADKLYCHSTRRQDGFDLEQLSSFNNFMNQLFGAPFCPFLIPEMMRPIDLANE
jgi:hypothetical protein